MKELAVKQSSSFQMGRGSQLKSSANQRIDGPSRTKRELRLRLRSTLFLLPAWFAPSSNLRVGFHRARGVKIESGVEIGYMVILDNLYPELVTIRSGATISARATVLAHDEAYLYAGLGDEKVAATSIGRGSFVGVNAVILPGVAIGDGAVIGAGAVVTSNVPDRTVVVGIPARPVVREAEE